MNVIGRTGRLIGGLAFAAVAVGLLLSAGMGFETSFAKRTLSCGAPVSESWPEQRPSGPSRAEVEYIERTGDLDAARAYDAEVIAFLEARACGNEARSRGWKLLVAAAVSWSIAGVLLRSAFRRRPRAPKPVALTAQ